METPRLPPIRCYRCGGKGYLWDHQDDVEFFWPCECLKSAELSDAIEAARQLVDQRFGHFYFPAIADLVDSRSVRTESHRLQLLEELKSYLTVSVETESRMRRYVALARLYHRLPDLPIQMKLGI